MDSINLLPQVAETEIKQGVYKKKVNLVAIGSLLVVGVVVVLLFAYQLYLSSREQTLTKEVDATKKEILAKKDVEIKQRSYIDKIQTVAGYLSTNKSTGSAYNKIIELAQTGQVSLTKVEVNTSGDIVIVGSTVNSSNLGTFIDNLTDKNAQVVIDKVVANSLALTSSGYQFTIRLIYTKPGLLAEKKNGS